MACLCAILHARGWKHGVFAWVSMEQDNLRIMQEQQSLSGLISSSSGEESIYPFIHPSLTHSLTESLTLRTHVTVSSRCAPAQYCLTATTRCFSSAPTPQKCTFGLTAGVQKKFQDIDMNFQRPQIRVHLKCVFQISTQLRISIVKAAVIDTSSGSYRNTSEP